MDWKAKSMNSRTHSASRGKRALLFPSYFGGGFGHVGRCLALAGELSRQNWTVAMVLAGRYVDLVRKAGYQVFQPLFPARPRRGEREPPAYTYILDGNVQALRDGLVRPWRVRAAVAEAQYIVRRFRPDVLIGDLSLLPWIVGQRSGLPVIQIVRSIMHPAAPRIIWWQEPPDGMISPDIRPVFDPVLSRWGLNSISRVEELVRGDMFLIPSIPELEPLPNGLSSTHYVGALIRSQLAAGALPAPLDKQTEKPVIYVTLGGGAGPVGNRRFFQKLNEALGETPWSVIVSTGRRFDPSDLPPAPPNMFYHQWVPGQAVIQRSSAVVFHGGYGTTMETVSYGVPSVVVPFHSEQESNGRRLEACSAARVLGPPSTGASMRLVRSR
jgi:UDP:flavonoid glycosyltransferase YjiC (YdhE family)